MEGGFMVDTGVFLVIAVLGVVVAGFASLLFAVRGTHDLEVLAAWRVRYIMTGGFNVAIASLGGVAIATFTEDQDLVVRLATALLLLISLGPLPWTLRSLGDKRVFGSQGEVVSWLIGAALFRALAVANLFVASVGLLVVVFVFVLIGGFSVFLSMAADIYPPAESGAAPPAS